MKDQYFGDVNDFRKYGLLRLLSAPTRLRLGICWMLTHPDDGLDGRFRSYLGQPQRYRYRDPDLFDWLKRVVGEEQDYRTARIEASTLLGQAVFQSKILTDNPSQRNEYFRECATQLGACEVVFFDPDNGLEIKRIRPGHKNSCKFLYWNEVCKTFASGPSVLIYQHFPRRKRDAYVAQIAENLKQRTGAAAVFSYRTPHVLFLLASQVKHVAEFRRQLVAVRSRWAPNEIVGTEHRTG